MVRATLTLHLSSTHEGCDPPSPILTNLKLFTPLSCVISNDYILRELQILNLLCKLTVHLPFHAMLLDS